MGITCVVGIAFLVSAATTMTNFRALNAAFPIAALMAVLLCTVPTSAALTTYTEVYAGGTISPGDTVLLDDGASVTGSVLVDGTLQFNQSGTAPTISSTLSGTGTLSLTNTGTLDLSGTTVRANTVVLDMTTHVSAGMLKIRSGNGSLRIGSSGTGLLDVNGGSVASNESFIGSNVGSNGTVTVSDGTWANSGSLTVGRSGTGTLTVASGLSSTALVTALQSGRAGGSWTGSSGFTSSAAASSTALGTLRSVGWLDNGNGSLSFAYAAAGDTNLDWSVDILDVSNVLAMGMFDTGLPATWIDGDFGYDGVVDILDVADFFPRDCMTPGTTTPRLERSPPCLSRVCWG